MLAIWVWSIMLYVRRNASGTVIVNSRILPPTFENKMQARKKLPGE